MALNGNYEIIISKKFYFSHRWLTNKTKRGKKNITKNSEQQTDIKKSKTIIFENIFPNKNQIEFVQNVILLI